jgi:hypothetical protein
MKNLRWSNASTEQLLKRLGPIPAQCGLKRLFGGVRVSDYADLIPGPHAKKVLNSYTCAVLSVGVSLLLCGLPDGQRFELVFEQQDIYMNHANIALATLLNDPNPHMRTKGGDSKLAAWSFAPSASTILLDQVDYLCYAFLQRYRDADSRKARWCAPILDSATETIGRLMTRDEIREAVAREPFPGSNLV